ncbi:hypothetical protein NOR51B_266 [Luminiphilus syltensis NOR5-1B]|uniref:Uncharacterized protein n=1 Tax=Luminiphilus syltensis NOR5-1B TaxID=565045 RepID=B8KWR1_9GAMM|nr:hypothetical protein [Luminiphilus syltensis]EED34329.1 hypothetical protein NOR51B_266 [Luminiphilus syltensis NOR5-1B]
MENTQQSVIRDALEESVDTSSEVSEPVSARSLQQQALERAADGYVPKTLTPHEWELYYQQHGVPEAHRKAGVTGSGARGEAGLLEKAQGEGSEPVSARSLQQQALERAADGYVPTTLTPHEWELYYQQYGVPEAHRKAGVTGGRQGGESGEAGLWEKAQKALSPGPSSE